MSTDRAETPAPEITPLDDETIASLRLLAVGQGRPVAAVVAELARAELARVAGRSELDALIRVVFQAGAAAALTGDRAALAEHGIRLTGCACVG